MDCGCFQARLTVMSPYPGGHSLSLAFSFLQGDLQLGESRKQWDQQIYLHVVLPLWGRSQVSLFSPLLSYALGRNP
jgi:hypothetical protein